MNKKRLIAFIAILALLVSVIGILVNGVTFGFAGKFYFTTKYYKTPTEAFLSGYSSTFTENNIEIEKQVDIIIIDDNNCMFLAITKDKKLLAAPMVFKNEKYAYPGELSLYDLDSGGDYKQETGPVMNRTSLYDSKGKFSSAFEWCIVFKEEMQSEIYNEFSYKEYEPDDFKSFIFIFK